MSRQKNMKKRNEILSIAFILFSKKEYNEVAMKDIADNAHISKSLLQYYFPQKKDIVAIMLTDLLQKSFEYIDYRFVNIKNIHLKLSVYTNLFFSAIFKQDHLKKFINNVIRNEDLLDLWINIVNDWLDVLDDTKLKNDIKDHYLIALTFSMSGGSKLLSKDNLEVSGKYIARIMIITFMNISDNSNSEIGQIIEQTEDLVTNTNIKDFEEYYQKRLIWYVNKEE
ncbi:TetR/AcrR family transcriptional regulator [Clostridium estertheticum]|uniref:TetR/AcrR family transcriptional regulator n=1 Tax=Clostridium estertheticum TaxID=238834 RepID=A0AA47EH79_9CLOT|nr:TetR/AcrR family transcriptional regulator [Clostridium estertheticum]MBU3154257.1 TetR/AcrR family transcriptional regulator [Clostridium estertheticum]WAG60151.1 TetR/AcrR family transcriptional regulator [Clostridium estertheticum]